MLPGTLIRDSVPKVFIWGWSHKHPLASVNRNCTPPAGQQVLSINHIVCAHLVDTVSHSYQLGNGGNAANPQFPDVSQEPASQAGLSEVCSLVPATLFSAHHLTATVRIV